MLITLTVLMDHSVDAGALGFTQVTAPIDPKQSSPQTCMGRGWQTQHSQADVQVEFVACARWPSHYVLSIRVALLGEMPASVLIELLATTRHTTRRMGDARARNRTRDRGYHRSSHSSPAHFEHRFQPSVGRILPHVTERGKMWVDVNQVRPSLPNFGPCWPMVSE